MTAVLCDLGIDQFLAMRLELAQMPSSSTPISRPYPATSPANIAASLRLTRSSIISIAPTLPVAAEIYWRV
jgi:hypothetical protein